MFGRRKDRVVHGKWPLRTESPDASAENTPMVLVLSLQSHNIPSAPRDSADAPLSRSPAGLVAAEFCATFRFSIRAWLP